MWWSIFFKDVIKFDFKNYYDSSFNLIYRYFSSRNLFSSKKEKEKKKNRKIQIRSTNTKITTLVCGLIVSKHSKIYIYIKFHKPRSHTLIIISFEGNGWRRIRSPLQQTLLQVWNVSFLIKAQTIYIAKRVISSPVSLAELAAPGRRKASGDCSPSQLSDDIHFPPLSHCPPPWAYPGGAADNKQNNSGSPARPASLLDEQLLIWSSKLVDGVLARTFSGDMTMNRIYRWTMR